MKSPAHVVRTAWTHGAWVAGEVARRGWPRELVHFYGLTPGDDLMCTAVLHEKRRRSRRRLWMMTRFPALFERNPDVDVVVPFDERYERMVSWLGGRAWHVSYGGHDHEADRSPIPDQHIIALLCRSAGIRGKVDLRPYLHLSAEERQFGAFAPNQIALHSSGQSANNAMKNKEWFPDRLQGVVHALRDVFTFVQVGAGSDPLLDGCRDLRGKTSMRETAAILANSTLFLGQVGFLMHLARAVDTPAVIIFGGREMPWQSGYSCNTNLFTPLACAPCWRWHACENPIERECMQAITVDQVASAVVERAARSNESLTVATVEVRP